MAGANQYGPYTRTALQRIARGAPSLNLLDLELTGLPPLPPILMHLECGHNRLTVLPPLPPTLETLGCSTNKLTVLPPLPPTLTRLQCSDNQLTELPALPPTLTRLFCRYNQLTALPPLPPTLTELYCHHNQQTVLPPLPPTLTVLDCKENYLTVLPPLPPGLTDLLCGDNPITSVTLPFPNGIRYQRMGDVFTGTRLQFGPRETLGQYEKKQAPKVETQLMGEQISRQTPALIPDVMSIVMKFANAKDPNRIVLDQAKNRGVALPRLPPETEAETALRLELAKPDQNQAKIAALRREVARRGGRRTRRGRKSRRKSLRQRK